MNQVKKAPFIYSYHDQLAIAYRDLHIWKQSNKSYRLLSTYVKESIRAMWFLCFLGSQTLVVAQIRTTFCIVNLRVNSKSPAEYPITATEEIQQLRLVTNPANESLFEQL